jgi:hypothetical protein
LTSEEGQTSTGIDVLEPDEENLCYPSPKLRKKVKIQDVRRSERLLTKSSISCKNHDLEINNYNMVNIQPQTNEEQTFYMHFVHNLKFSGKGGVTICD